MSSLLIVDDDITLLQQFQASLSDLVDLRVARRAADVVRLCRQSPPDLLMLDLKLDDGDGLALLELMKADAELANIPVMFVSSESDADQRARAYDLGAVDWLVKPVDEQRLRARVQSALGKTANQRSVPPAAGHSLPPSAVVLAVDDDQIVLDALANTFANDALTLYTATSARLALDHIARQPPELVLLDIGLPGIDGFELAQRMTAIPVMVDVPLIIVTQFGDVDSEIRALEMGAYDFVSKPFLPTVLRARVGNALRLRRRTLASLQKAEEQWRRVTGEQLSAIVAHARDAIISINADGRIALANEAASRLLGDTALPLAGAALPAWLIAALPAELLSGAARHVADLVFNPPGRAPLTCDVSALADTASGRRLVTLTFQDQTQRLQAAAAARENLRVQAESRTKQLMMSYLTHEIGNPLNGVVNLTALLLNPGADPLTPNQARRLGLVKESAEVLRRLMHDALDLARLEAGQFSLQLAATPLRDIVAYCIESSKPAAQANGMTIEEPRGDLDAVVQADSVRLRQCLHNLVSNACKYGKTKGKIRIDVLESEGQVSVSVSDDGTGITPEQVQRLFEPYERLGQHRTSGHGLGLAVTRMLMLAMGGRIDVSSEVGVGSRFTLVLRQPSH